MISLLSKAFLTRGLSTASRGLSTAGKFAMANPYAVGTGISLLGTAGTAYVLRDKLPYIIGIGSMVLITVMVVKLI
jgi:hypothetical protein